MGWERIAEKRIRDAMQEGEFDNLPPAPRRAFADRRTQVALVLERARMTQPCS